MFNREPVQSWQNQDDMDISGSSKNSSCDILDQLVFVF